MFKEEYYKQGNDLGFKCKNISDSVRTHIMLLNENHVSFNEKRDYLTKLCISKEYPIPTFDEKNILVL